MKIFKTIQCIKIRITFGITVIEESPTIRLREN